MSTAWTHDAETLEEAFEMLKPEGYIDFEQFHKEVSSAENNNRSNHGDLNLPGSDDPISRIQLGAMVSTVTDCDRIPMGQLPTARQLLSDNAADQEHEITRMLRHAGIQAERPNYKISVKTSRKSVFTGSEPLPVVGLHNVYVDDSFFVMENSSASDITSGPDQPQSGMSDPRTGKQIPDKVIDKIEVTKSKLLEPLAKNGQNKPSTRFLTPREVYFSKNNKN